MFGNSIDQKLHAEYRIISLTKKEANQSITEKQIRNIIKLASQFINEIKIDCYLQSYLPKFIHEVTDQLIRKCYYDVEKICQELYYHLKSGNGYIARFNPILLFAAGSNNAAMLLGSSKQGKAALFYIVNYVSKEKVEIAHCNSVLREAIKNTAKFPSRADNIGTDKRKGMHVFTRALNKLNLRMEVADYQIAASLLGLPIEITSENFVYISPISHIKLMEYVIQSKNIEIKIIKISSFENKKYNDTSLVSTENDQMRKEHDE